VDKQVRATIPANLPQGKMSEDMAHGITLLPASLIVGVRERRCKFVAAVHSTSLRRSASAQPASTVCVFGGTASHARCAAERPPVLHRGTARRVVERFESVDRFLGRNGIAPHKLVLAWSHGRHGPCRPDRQAVLGLNRPAAPIATLGKPIACFASGPSTARIWRCPCTRRGTGSGFTCTRRGTGRRSAARGPPQGEEPRAGYDVATSSQVGVVPMSERGWLAIGIATRSRSYAAQRGLQARGQAAPIPTPHRLWSMRHLLTVYAGCARLAAEAGDEVAVEVRACLGRLEADPELRRGRPTARLKQVTDNERAQYCASFTRRRSAVEPCMSCL
jgi:hypothetical protein